MFDLRTPRELSVIAQLAEAHGLEPDEWVNDPEVTLDEALQRSHMLQVARAIACENTAVRITSTVPLH